LGGQILTQALPGSLHLTKLELVVNRKTLCRESDRKPSRDRVSRWANRRNPAFFSDDR
jgi:hypothetical protein